MVQISQLKLPVDHSPGALNEKIRKILNLKKEEKFTYQILKRSIDGRKKPDLYYVYSLAVETGAEKRILKRPPAGVLAYQPRLYQFPERGSKPLKNPPAIIGAGPAGLFAALLLTELGYCPRIFERGAAIEQRKTAVEAFWKIGLLDPATNVQFGEGGAGAFSDGKLNTAVKDPAGRNRFVLETFVRFGAPSSILYDNKPHIGTDVLARVIYNMRSYLEEKGARFFFGTLVTDLRIEGGRVTGLICGDREYAADAVILAIGHSARDTMHKLYDRGLPMEAKAFAVGFRVEHPQKMMDLAMYGRERGCLPAAPYKVTSNFPGGRGVYSFCMCPGGYVVNSSSEAGRLAVNGMSYSGRSGDNANSAIIVSVKPEEFGGQGPLAGIAWQRKLEEQAFALCTGKEITVLL